VSGEGLTEAEKEALEVGTSLFGWSDNATALRHPEPVVESILADRTSALVAEVERLRGERDALRADRDDWKRNAEDVAEKFRAAVRRSTQSAIDSINATREIAEQRDAARAALAGAGEIAERVLVGAVRVGGVSQAERIADALRGEG